MTQESYLEEFNTLPKRIFLEPNEEVDGVWCSCLFECVRCKKEESDAAIEKLCKKILAYRDDVVGFFGNKEIVEINLQNDEKLILSYVMVPKAKIAYKSYLKDNPELKCYCHINTPLI